MSTPRAFGRESLPQLAPLGGGPGLSQPTPVHLMRYAFPSHLSLPISLLGREANSPPPMFAFLISISVFEIQHRKCSKIRLPMKDFSCTLSILVQYFRENTIVHSSLPMSFRAFSIPLLQLTFGGKGDSMWHPHVDLRVFAFSRRQYWLPPPRCSQVVFFSG